jgi:hypothetical protein
MPCQQHHRRQFFVYMLRRSTVSVRIYLWTVNHWLRLTCCKEKVLQNCRHMDVPYIRIQENYIWFARLAYCYTFMKYQLGSSKPLAYKGYIHRCDTLERNIICRLSWWSVHIAVFLFVIVKLYNCWKLSTFWRNMLPQSERCSVYDPL